MTQLGLSSDSVQGYNIGEIHRPSGGAAPTPELLPCGYLVGDSNTISIQLKGDSLKKNALLVSSQKSHTCAWLTCNLCGFRRGQRQRGLAGVRQPDPQAHAAALRLAAEGAQTRHPVRTQRHRQDLPGQSAVSTPAADGGPTLDPTRRRHVQRGSQVRQSKSRAGFSP